MLHPAEFLKEAGWRVFPRCKRRRECVEYLHQQVVLNSAWIHSLRSRTIDPFRTNPERSFRKRIETVAVDLAECRVALHHEGAFRASRRSTFTGISGFAPSLNGFSSKADRVQVPCGERGDGCCGGRFPPACPAERFMSTMCVVRRYAVSATLSKKPGVTAIAVRIRHRPVSP